MKKFLLLGLALFVAIAAQAQEVPYAKYLDFDKGEFKEHKFKYDERTNAWILRKINGLKMTGNVLAVLADAVEDVRPNKNDYAITVQLGKEDEASYVRVVFYSDETYHKLLTFLKDNGRDMVETSSGKLIKYQAYCGEYAVELNMEQHLISRTSARTIDYKTVKNVDESYNEYRFIIRTDVEPWSQYIDRQVEKQLKREAKGKKKQSVEELM